MIKLKKGVVLKKGVKVKPQFVPNARRVAAAKKKTA